MTPEKQSISHRPQRRLFDLLKVFSYAIAPHFCPLCRAECQAYLCSECLLSLKTPSFECHRCALPLEANSLECAQCLKEAPSFERTVCAFEYSGLMPVIISRFKDHGDLALIPALAIELKTKLQKAYNNQALPSLLAPVPNHWQKRWQRGFNQSELITKHLSRSMKIPYKGIAVKTKRTLTQKQLSRKERLKNLTSSFAVRDDELKGQHIAIIDDVITTGSTANVLAQCCLDAGAARVDVWALARTPKKLRS